MVKTTLTSAPDGWVGVMPTGLGGGYGFYMTFDENQVVTMYADLNDSTSSKVRQSQYRIRQDMGTALTFDTYTYITLLNDPTPSVFGGNIREGFRSDIDFIFDYATSDSIVFIGKRYRQKLALARATAAQKAQYTTGGYLAQINAFKKFFSDNPNAYIEMDNGAQKVALEQNSSNNLSAGKRVTITAIKADGSVVSAVGKFAYTVDQMAASAERVFDQCKTQVRR